MDSWIAFVPHPLIAGGHAQTICGHFLPGRDGLRNTSRHTVTLADGDQLVYLENRPQVACRGSVVVLAHGLAGSADSGYMLRMGSVFAERGWTVVRMNHRGAGDGRGLAARTYHCSSSGDIAAVLASVNARHPDKRLVVIGLSLSGNAVLKMLGEERTLPARLCGAIALAPPIEMERCARNIARRENWIYDTRFVGLLRAEMKPRIRRGFRLPATPRLADFDERVTAPMYGFADARDYYRQVSARQFLGGIRVPTVIVAAADDPLVPFASFDGLESNPNVRLVTTRGGGHLGYIARTRTPLGDRRWLDYFAQQQAEALVS